jgi:DNA-binding transcriptional LysR family regulator
VRIAEVHEPHLVAHRLAESTRVPWAAPNYVERRSVPANVAELSQHDYLVLRDRNQPFGVWRLTGPNGAEKAKVSGRLSSNNAEIVRGWAIDGHRILLPSRWDVHADWKENGPTAAQALDQFPTDTGGQARRQIDVSFPLVRMNRRFSPVGDSHVMCSGVSAPGPAASVV